MKLVSQIRQTKEEINKLRLLIFVIYLIITSGIAHMYGDLKFFIFSK